MSKTNRDIPDYKSRSVHMTHTGRGVDRPNGSLTAQVDIRVQLNRYLIALCYIEVAAAGPEWEDAINAKMADAILPPNLTPDGLNRARSSEKVKVASRESLRIWRERNPGQEEVDQAKALLSKSGYKGFRERYPHLAKSLFPSIHASERIWQKRITTLVRIRDAIYKKHPQGEDRGVHKAQFPQCGSRTTSRQPRTLHIALVDAYQDLGIGEGLRSEVNRTDPSLILLGTIWSINSENLRPLLRHLDTRIHQTIDPTNPGQI
jgi:hypothetical protein